MSYILSYINSIWALESRKLQGMLAAYRAWATDAAIEFDDEFDRPEYQKIGNTAIIPITGVIGKKMNMISRYSGGTSTEFIARDFQAAIDDYDIDRVILHIDSPGGSVDGVQTLADTIRAGRDKKQIVAFIDGMGASAAYWIASAASSVYASEKTAFIGSIGCYQVHVDRSGADTKYGENHTVIRAGKYKAYPDSTEPLTDTGKELMQTEVDQIYKIFVETVAKNRIIPEAAIYAQESKIFLAEEAQELGLIDGIISFQSLIEGASNMNTDDKNRIDEMTAQLTQAQEERDQALKALESQKRQFALSSIKEKFDNLVTSGKITPAQRGLFAADTLVYSDESIMVPVESVVALLENNQPNDFTTETKTHAPKAKSESEKLTDIANANGLNLSTTAGYREAVKLLQKGG